MKFKIPLPILYDPQEDLWYSLWRCSVAEFFGTAIFVFLGTGAVESAIEFLHGSTDGTYVSLIILVAMGHGFAITLTIYTIGDVSGGKKKSLLQKKKKRKRIKFKIKKNS